MTVEQAYAQQTQLTQTLAAINAELASSGAAMASQGITLKTYTDASREFKQREIGLLQDYFNRAV